jgi:23S rRNA (cytosine1962-C5)-methyltransferase
MSYPIIHLKSGRDRQLLLGHPWIFSGALKNIEQNIEPGSFVRVKNSKKQIVGTGYYNPQSQICVRIVSFQDNVEINQEFLELRLRQAFDRRKAFINEAETDAFRLVHSEADGLPGIIVDKYADYLVIQCHTLGAEKLKEWLINAAVKVFSPTGIYEKSEVAARKHEGLGQGNTGTVFGEDPPQEITVKEYGLQFKVSLTEGQKTGFFIDQRENRKLVRAIAAGKRVLNLYSFSGATSVAALAGGAKEVISVDVDQGALDLLEDNLKLNDLDPAAHKSVAADVNKYLTEVARYEEPFDLIILDPPAFAKHKSAIKKATRGYQDINAKTMRNLKEGGFLLSCSCSGLISNDDFRNIMMNAARDVGKPMVLLADYPQPFDHPTLPAFQEGRYLKSFLLQLPE